MMYECKGCGVLINLYAAKDGTLNTGCPECGKPMMADGSVKLGGHDVGAVVREAVEAAVKGMGKTASVKFMMEPELAAEVVHLLDFLESVMPRAHKAYDALREFFEGPNDAFFGCCLLVKMLEHGMQPLPGTGAPSAVGMGAHILDLLNKAETCGMFSVLVEEKKPEAPAPSKKGKKR